MRRAWRLAAPLALVLACAEDPVPKLEAETAALLESTLPKPEFWSEVEKKGEILKQQRALDEEQGAIAAKRPPLDAEIEQLAAAVQGAEEVNARATELLVQNQAELDRLESEVRAREETLAGFRERARGEGTR